MVYATSAALIVLIAAVFLTVFGLCFWHRRVLARDFRAGTQTDTLKFDEHFLYANS